LCAGQICGTKVGSPCTHVFEVRFREPLATEIKPAKILALQVDSSEVVLKTQREFKALAFCGLCLGVALPIGSTVDGALDLDLQPSRRGGDENAYEEAAPELNRCRMKPSSGPDKTQGDPAEHGQHYRRDRYSGAGTDYDVADEKRTSAADKCSADSLERATHAPKIFKMLGLAVLWVGRPVRFASV
jgi:hypothetical protein